MVKLRHESTIDTSLYSNCTGLHSCVLSTGEIVFHGTKTTSDDNRQKFYIFNSNGRFSGRSIDTLCRHDLFNNILPLTINGREYLCNSCYICGNIRLIDVQSKEVTIAYYAGVWNMCLGEKGSLYMVSNEKVSILDVTRKNFTLQYTFPNIENALPDNMCYIGESGLLVLSSRKKLFHAVNTQDGSTIWDAYTQSIDKTGLEVSGLIYHPGTKMLVVGDHVNNMLIVVNSGTGQLIGSEQLRSRIYDVHLTGDDQLIVRHGPVMDLSFFSISSLKKDEVQIQTSEVVKPVKIQNESKMHKKTSFTHRKRKAIQPCVDGDVITRKQIKIHRKSSTHRNGKVTWNPNRENPDEVSDNKLSKLASIISATAMRTTALEYFEIDNVFIDDIETSRRENVKQFKLDLLISWRNKNQPSTQDLVDILNDASGRGLVSRSEVNNILKVELPRGLLTGSGCCPAGGCCL